MMNIKTSVLLLTLAFFAAACSDKKESSNDATPAASNSMAESFWMAQVDGTPRGVKDIVANGKDGEAVLVAGRVGGNADVFVPGRAAFLIADLSLKDCYDMTDECKQPWDYCCEDPAALKTGTLAVECRGGERVLAQEVRGFHTLDHGRDVVIRGVVKRSAAGSLVLMAVGINVTKGRAP